MATVTPNYSWPVPTSSDYVKDGATAIEALGDAIDATVFALPTGLALLNTTTFTGQSSVIIDGVFSSTYRNYKFTFSPSAVSGTDIPIYWVMRSGTPAADVTTNYEQQTASARSTTLSGVLATIATITTATTAVGDYSFAQMDLLNPNVTQRTGWLGSNFYAPSSGNSYLQTFGGAQSSTTQFTGIKFYPSSGTFGGTIKVYGYK